jgi:L-lactate dehydrogenase complex protein LldF
MIIHHATDAREAVQIVLEIALRSQARLIAKSKTMVGEEIEVNRGLEAGGLRVVETDLGEFIVQLRGEPPSHIITPAVHLRRSDVAQTFHEKLGLPYNDDIPAMTAAARQVLRQTFLETDIGISGVNLGVVESGALCLVTNEGNGRMVTTLPPVHIALMGIERLVPTWADLVRILNLLPRSATGQKLSVYTSLIHGPRRPGELDGPMERHLVLVDNGRRTLARSRIKEILYCIRCGACMNACPVFREIGGHAYVGAHGEITPYPGPVGSVLSPGLFGASEFGQLARASSLCGACKEACPVDIDLPSLLLRVRAGMATQQESGALPCQTPATPASKPASVPSGLNLSLRLFTWAAVSQSRFTFAQRLAWLFGRLFAPSTEWLRLPAFTGWGTSKDFPRPPRHTFRQVYATSPNQNALPVSSSHPHLHPRSEIELTSDQVQLPAQAAAGSLLSQESLYLRFKSELELLGGFVTRCQPDKLAETILTFLNSREVTAIQAWDAQHLPPGLLDFLSSNGITIQSQPNPDLAAGLTGASAGIAETGSLVITSGPGQPLTASLLPEIHLAILKDTDLLEHVDQVVDPQFRCYSEMRSTSSAVWITGPSRTADIEMTLTIGVHGPREVHVFYLSSGKIFT